MNAYWKYNLKYSKSLHLPKLINPVQDLSQLTTGLTEVNDPKTVKIGKSWRADELRLKSDSDLHKLWYVLLKERLALKSDQYLSAQSLHSRKETDRLIKNCIGKVHISMSRLRGVIGERITLRNEFMTFLEFYYIRKMQSDPEYKIAREPQLKKVSKKAEVKTEQVSQELTEVAEQKEVPVVEKRVEKEKKVVIRGALETENREEATELQEEAEVEEGPAQEETLPTKKVVVSVLTEEEKVMAQKLTKKYREKELINEYISNSHMLQGKERRRVRSIIDVSRATHAKTIFMKEMAAVSYKYKNLKQSKNPDIRKLENLS